jgi:Cu+-exporting ATPase
MNHSSTPSVAVIDPVCGMTIDPAKAVGSSTYNDQTYHFCSRGCEASFDAAPAEYTGTASAPVAAGSCCSPKTPAQPGGHCC